MNSDKDAIGLYPKVPAPETAERAAEAKRFLYVVPVVVVKKVAKAHWVLQRQHKLSSLTSTAEQADPIGWEVPR